MIGAEALTLAQLENFRPEDGMILANTTSIGMHPKVDESPIPKVCIILDSAMTGRLQTSVASVC